MLNELKSPRTTLELPIVAPEPSSAHQAGEWEGFRPLEALRSSELAPEPEVPQGIYNPAEPEAPIAVPVVPKAPAGSTELLAPAGGLDAGYAAFHYGADAIYLGLKKFSARAEAENFTLEEVDQITAYAHQLSPPRKIFVTINTLIRQDEVAELIETLFHLDGIGVDAIILQDLGVYRALRKYFPRLQLHGSTQMAVHNRAGASVLHRLGFSRVVLARELTFEEVEAITSSADVETEVFIHGALCYSYSGLCLFSAQTLGRSGNRGKCAYSCRDSYEVADAPLTLRDGSPVKRDPRQGFPFSMKDLALPDHMPALQAAGVSCFKIEGRKKSPLYVATTTHYYRKLLDGTLSDDDRPDFEAEMQTVFSRPWTRLFVQSHKDKEVADRDTVGHRGTRIGDVENVVKVAKREFHLRFRTTRALQKHDGLQIDLPTLGKPFGFAVDTLWLLPSPKGKGREVFEVPEGSWVEVPLPSEHPEIPLGAPIYCSSSQQVKQKYRYTTPKPGQFAVRTPVSVDVHVSAQTMTVRVALAEPTEEAAIEVEASLVGPFDSAQDPHAMEAAAKACFERLGQSSFRLDHFRWENPDGCFVPVSRLNPLRRQVFETFQTKVDANRQERLARLQADVASPVRSTPSNENQPLAWSIKIDRMEFLNAFAASDFTDVEEIIVDIARDHPAVLRDQLASLADRLGRDRIRLALPALTRAWEEKGLRQKVRQLMDAGWNRWEASNWSAWDYLDTSDSSRPTLDLATDWSIYVLNRLAALELIEWGVTRFALSPEDGHANWRALATEFPEQAVLIVHQDTPLFLAESCAYANLIGGCPGKANCSFESMEMESSHGEKVTALDYHCRTIVLNQGPFCLSTRLREIANLGVRKVRADFVYRKYDPQVVLERWKKIRAGAPVPGGHAANWDRGLL